MPNINEGDKSEVYFARCIFWGLVPFYWYYLQVGETISRMYPISDGEYSSNSHASASVTGKNTVSVSQGGSRYLEGTKVITLSEGNSYTFPTHKVLYIFGIVNIIGINHK